MIFTIQPDPHPSRERALHAVRTAPIGYVVEIREPGRSIDQNAAQWPILEAISRQRKWPVNGVMCDLTPEEWKDVLTAAFEQDTVPRIAAGFNGGVVMLGRRTSKYGKKRFSAWLDWLSAASVELGVNDQLNATGVSRVAVEAPVGRGKD